MRYRRIPDETVRRMPFYLRAALSLSQKGVAAVSSQELADLVGTNPAQVRKDFSYFGDFGTRGVGYEIEPLIKRIRRVLRLDRPQKAALVGVGNLGSALLTFRGFAAYGFQIAAAFDIDKRKIGCKRGDVKVEDIALLGNLGSRGISLGILATPEAPAQELADQLVDAGVKGILSFAPGYINVPKKVKLVTIDIAMDLARLPFYLPAG